MQKQNVNAQRETRQTSYNTVSNFLNRNIIHGSTTQKVTHIRKYPSVMFPVFS